MKSFKAPAKINIVLRVTGRRANGYHDLLMLNETLDVYDEIEIEVGSRKSEVGSQIKITCDDRSVPCDETNICYKAAAKLLELVQGKFSVKIHIIKRIPVAAGLGGGSSDAAAVLRGLNEILDLNLSREKLSELGVKLGADVPFFLYDKPAVCEGIGDKVTTLDSLPNMWILLINPNFPASTKWVYEEFDKLPNLAQIQLTPDIARARLPRFFKELGEVAKVVHNDLELVTAEKFPEIKQIKKQLVDNGAIVSWMSGSGPTVVGMFRTEKDRVAAAKKIRKNNSNWRVIETSNIKN